MSAFCWQKRHVFRNASTAHFRPTLAHLLGIDKLPREAIGVHVRHLYQGFVVPNLCLPDLLKSPARTITRI